MLHPSRYSVWSRRTGLSYANGTGIDYSYDTASRLQDVNNGTDTGQLKYAYRYDDVGNRLSMSATDSSGTRVYDYDHNLNMIHDRRTSTPPSPPARSPRIHASTLPPSTP